MKAAFPGGRAVLLAQVPLAGHGGEVAGLAQHFGHGDAARQQLAMKAARVGHHHAIEPAHAGLVRI